MTIRKRNSIEYYYYLRTHKNGKREEIPLGRNKASAFSRHIEIERQLEAENLYPNIKARTNIPWLAVFLYKRCKIAAKKRGIDFLITPDDIEKLATRAAGRCELTGIAFSFETYKNKKIRPWSPSIDRIHSDQGYTFANVRLVCSAVNLALNQFGEGTLMKIAKALIKNKLGRIVT